jgi:hypothetical protein
VVKKYNSIEEENLALMTQLQAKFEGGEPTEDDEDSDESNIIKFCPNHKKEGGIHGHGYSHHGEPCPMHLVTVK